MPDNIFTYTKRAAFFARKMASESRKKMAEQAMLFVESASAEGLGVPPGLTDEDLKFASGLKIHPGLFFAYPNLLTQKPGLVQYYRCLSCVPHKGMQRLGLGTKYRKVEEEPGEYLTGPEADSFCEKINPLILKVFRAVAQDGHIDKGVLRDLIHGSVGASVDGSWRNEIGQQGERLVKGLIKDYFEQEHGGYLALVKPGKVPRNEVSESELRKVSMFSDPSGNLKVEFSSEPDVTILLGSKVVGFAEVKAGTDPAGLYERLGATMKSFTDAQKKNPKSRGVLICSITSDEITTRLKEARIPYLMSEELEGNPEPLFSYLNQVFGH